MLIIFDVDVEVEVDLKLKVKIYLDAEGFFFLKLTSFLLLTFINNVGPTNVGHFFD